MKTIHVATIEHRHGTNIYAGETYLLAFSAIVDYARDNWDEIGTDAPPEDELTMVDLYFAAMDDEWYNIEEITLIQATTAPSTAA